MKVFVRFLILVAVLGIIGIIIVGMSLNALVKTGVETLGPKVLGVPVTLKEVDVSLLSGGKDMRVSLNELIIENPAGYKTDYAFSLSNIRVLVDRNSVLTNTVVIDEIMLDRPVITFEGSLRSGNLGNIQNNLKRSISSEPYYKFEKYVHIKKVIMRNAKINLSLFKEGILVKNLTVPNFQLRDIGKASGGTRFSKAFAAIFDSIYEAIIKAVMKPSKRIPKSFDKPEKTAKENREKSWGRTYWKGCPTNDFFI